MRPPATDGERLVQVADWGQVALTSGSAPGQWLLVQTLFVAEGADPDEVLQLAARWQSQAGGPLLIPTAATLDGHGPAGHVAVRLQRTAPRGSTLAEVAAGHGAMSEAMVAALVVDLVAALLACHRGGLVVGGLGTDRLFVCPPGLDGAAALNCHDAGLAALVACAGHPPPAVGSRSFSHLYGAAATAAPELLDGRAPTAASDLYGLCATMARLLLGRHVHDATEPALLRHAARSGVPTEVTSALHKAAPALCGAILRGLSTAPLLRAGAGAEVGAAIAAVLSEAQLRRLMASQGGDPWAIGSPLIPLAAYARATSYADRFDSVEASGGGPRRASRAQIGKAGPTPGDGAEAAQDKRAELSEGMRRARLEAALAELETRRAITDRRGAGRRITVASLVIILVTAALCAVILWVGMKRTRVFGGAVVPTPEQTRPPPPLELPRRRHTPIAPPAEP